MGTRMQLRVAGVLALLTAAFLGGALVAAGGGPPSTHPNGILSWHAGNATQVQLGAVLWLLAMLGLVAFAVAFREAMWASVADRSWATVLFLQGASVFATIAVVSAAMAWSLAHQAGAGTIEADLAATVWSLEQALLRFATWGFTVPLGVVALALFRHSVLGQVCAVAAAVIAAALLVPLTWSAALYAFPAWLLLAAITLLLPWSPAHASVPASEEGADSM
jgi:hypothetical protein